jgi:hypothetical protein
MRTRVICLAVGLLLLSACDKKKAAPTETSGSIRQLRTAPSAPVAPEAARELTRIG